MQRAKPVQAKLIEFYCDCGGVYRLKQNPPVTQEYNYIWLHQCTGCGEHIELARPYPMVEVDNGRGQEKSFVLLDALPVTGDPTKGGV